MADFKPFNSKANTPEVSSNGWTIIRGRADFGKVQYHATGRIVPELGASDAIEMCVIPANTYVFSGYYKITVGEGAAVTCDIGSTSGGTQYLTSTSLQTAGNWVILADPNFDADDTDFPTADTTVYAAPDAAMDLAVLDVMFICVPATSTLIADND